MAGKKNQGLTGKAALERYARSAHPFTGVDEVQKERIWRQTKRALEAEALAPAPKRRRRLVLLAPWGAAAAGVLLAVGAVGYALGIHQGADLGAKGAMSDLSGPLPQVTGIPNDVPTGLNTDTSLLRNVMTGLQVVSPDGNWLIQSVRGSLSTQLMNLNGVTETVSDQPGAIAGPYGNNGFLVQTYNGYTGAGFYGVFPNQHRMVPLLTMNSDTTQIQTVVSSGSHFAAICNSFAMHGLPQQWVNVDGRVVDSLAGAIDLAWSPNGRWLAVILEGQPGQPFSLGIFDPMTGKLRVVDANLAWSGIPRAEHNLNWNMNGTLLGVSANGVLRVYTLDGHRVDTSLAITQTAWLSPNVLLAVAPHQTSLVVEQWLKDHLVQAKGPELAGEVQQISDIGNHMALVQTTQGVWVVTATGAVQLVAEPVEIAWYNETDQRVYFVAKHDTEIQQVDVAVDGRTGGVSS